MALADKNEICVLIVMHHQELCVSQLAKLWNLNVSEVEDMIKNTI